MSVYFERTQKSVSFLKNWLAGEEPPQICVVLGSGLSSSVPPLQDERILKYDEVPGFKKVTVEGHIGEIRFGKVTHGSKLCRVAFLRGRIHAYEGNTPGDVVHNIRTLVTLGCRGVVLTNASGCLNPDWKLGNVMIIRDHINQTRLSPNFGEYGDGFGKRFVDLTHVYDTEWQNAFKAVATEQKHTLYDGIYYGVQGPDYETPAEIRMMRLLGADAVGMSTVLEAIAARHLGARVAGLSCLTNYGAGIQGAILEHNHVIDMGKKFSKNISEVLMAALPRLPL